MESGNPVAESARPDSGGNGLIARGRAPRIRTGRRNYIGVRSGKRTQFSHRRRRLVSLSLSLNARVEGAYIHTPTSRSSDHQSWSRVCAQKACPSSTTTQLQLRCGSAVRSPLYRARLNNRYCVKRGKPELTTGDVGAMRTDWLPPPPPRRRKMRRGGETRQRGTEEGEATGLVLSGTGNTSPPKL